MKILVAIYMLLFFSFNIYAHRVLIYAYIEGDKIFTESTFQRGNPVKGGSIRLFNSDKKLLLEGKTNDDGKFSFKIPNGILVSKSSLTIELYAGEGHKTALEISYEELADKVKNSDVSGKKARKTLGDVPEESAYIGTKIVLGLTSITIIFTLLYYIKRKLKI